MATGEDRFEAKSGKRGTVAPEEGDSGVCSAAFRRPPAVRRVRPAERIISETLVSVTNQDRSTSRGMSAPSESRAG